MILFCSLNEKWFAVIMDIDKHANWLLGAFHTSAWFVTNHGKLYFLCSRGPYVKLFLDRAISHVSVSLIFKVVLKMFISLL